MADFDALIVGSGHNALCAALYLAAAGWRVAVLEKNGELGGGARTGFLTGVGFKHDLYATNISAFLSSPVYRDFGPEFEQAGLELLRHDRPFASVFSGESALSVYRDVAKTADGIRTISERDCASWIKTADLFGRLAPRLLPLMSCSMPSTNAARQAVSILARPFDAIDALRLGLGSCRAWTERLFESSQVRALLSPWAFHTDFGPDDPGGALYAFIAAFSAAHRGLVSPKGGVGSLTTAILESLKRREVVLRPNSPVARIEIRNGAATGVQLTSGERLTAARAVVAGVSPQALVNGLVDPAQAPASAQRLASFGFGPGTFVVHLALRSALQWRARDDLCSFFYVHLNGAAVQIERTLDQVRNGLLPDLPMMAVSQPTALDKSRAPAGHHIVRLHIRCVPRMIMGDAIDQISERDWKTAKEPFARRVISLLATHAPNVYDELIDYAAVTPADIEHDNQNMQGGDCSGGSSQLRQQYIFRPAFGWSSHRTPISRLYLTGAGTWPGAGIHGQSGYLAARQILSRAAL
jgi:phytoene dehydrogenase-like protein